MSISYLLDSSVLILSLRQDTKTLKRIDDLTAVYISAIALGELYHGAKHSVHVEKSVKAARDNHFTWIAELALEQW